MNEIEKQRVAKVIGEYCRNRIHPHVRSKIKLLYTIRGNDVKIIESRPHWQNPEQWTEMFIARLKYNPNLLNWELFWRRANGKWEKYHDYKPQNDLKKIIQEIDSDPYHVFWG